MKKEFEALNKLKERADGYFYNLYPTDINNQLDKFLDQNAVLYQTIESAITELEAIKKQLLPENIVNFSDGYHTFNELYHHRAILFSVIVNHNPQIAWKSKYHHDGTMFENMFIVGIDTPKGQATYHYDINPYWNYFKVKELEKAPVWDGHTPQQAIERLYDFGQNESELESIKQRAEEQKNKHAGDYDWYGSRDPVIAVIDLIIKGEGKGK